MRATVRALIVANDFLARQNEALSVELDYAWKWISPGFTRSTLKRRMTTGDPDQRLLSTGKDRSRHNSGLNWA
ncbi:MAG: hypothetical protein QOF14_3792 [Hyphomicrobiales bacterium]|jgi:hypothetical protein|nr:hypothetical protein [Hyphomicrobiales bacterium]